MAHTFVPEVSQKWQFLIAKFSPIFLKKMKQQRSFRNVNVEIRALWLSLLTRSTCHTDRKLSSRWTGPSVLQTEVRVCKPKKSVLGSLRAQFSEPTKPATELNLFVRPKTLP